MTPWLSPPGSPILGMDLAVGIDGNLPRREIRPSGRGAKGGRPGGSARSCRKCAAAKRKCTHNCPGRLPTGSGKGGAPAGLAPGSNSSTHDQQPPPNPPKTAARRSGHAPGPCPPDVGRKNLFPRPGGESARVAEEEASRRKASKPQGQSREDAAWIILQTAHCMKVRVHRAGTSWPRDTLTRLRQRNI